MLGFDVEKNPDKVRRVIGLAGQSAAVDPNLTGRENLKLIGTLAQLPRKFTKARADQLLERFGLSAAGDRPIKTYSGGMRRRLDVAAALVAKPPVIFLDEPTTGLDIQSRTELWAVIRELVAEGSTVLLTTQYLEEADQLADRIAVINAGKVVANDTAANLKQQLGASVIEVTLSSEAEAARAQMLLTPFASAPPEREGGKVHLSTPDAPRILTQVLRTLDANNMQAAGISVREPSLDDVFLSLTGKGVDTHMGASAPNLAASSVSQAAGVVSHLREELEPLQQQIPAPVAAVGTSGDLERLLQELPYKAGSGALTDNLLELARAVQNYYREGGGAPNEPIEVAPLTGFLTLEQRLGRISARVAPEQAAALLMGAAIASGSGLMHDGRSNGQSNDFAEGAVRILLEGIAETSARAQR